MSQSQDLSQSPAAARKRLQRSKLKDHKVVTIELHPELAGVLALAVSARGTNFKNFIERHLHDHFMQSDFLDLLEGMGEEL